MSEISKLVPENVWSQFDAITQVPRPSKKEAKIIKFLEDFAASHNLEYKKDAVGNVAPHFFFFPSQTWAAPGK